MKKSYRVLRQCLSSTWVYPDYIVQDSSKAAHLGHPSLGAPPIVIQPAVGQEGDATGNADPPKDDPAAGALAIARAAVEQSWNILYEELKRAEASMPTFRLVHPPKPPIVTSPRPGEIQIDIHVREGLYRSNFLTGLKNSGWKVKGGTFSEGLRSTKIEIERDTLHAAVLNIDAKAAHIAQITVKGANGLAGKGIFGSMKSLMHAANNMVQETKKSDGTTLRYWDPPWPAGEEVFDVVGRTVATLPEEDIPLYLKEMYLDVRAHDKMLDALLRDMIEDIDMKKPQGFQRLQDEFLHAAPRSMAQTSEALKPEDPGPFGSATAGQAAAKLETLGCKVYCPQPRDKFQWDRLAGYAELKAAIDDTLILGLREPEVYDDVARATRKHFQSNRPRAILFEGPPGCGKTTTARIIASQASVPLVYAPLESFQSKWYGQAEKNLAEIFKQTEECGKPSGGAILFLDELDGMATSRQGLMQEATRRTLGVLLRNLDGFALAEQCVVTVIGATNRQQDLDHALRSRFSASISFYVPDKHTRQAIIQDYARQLGEADVAALAAATDGASGRDLKAICEQAERTWASQIVRGKAERGSTPPISSYIDAAKKREQELSDPTRSKGEKIRLVMPAPLPVTSLHV